MVKIDVVFADPKEITDDEMSRLVDDEVVHYEIIDGGSLRGIPKMAKLKSLTAAKKTPYGWRAGAAFGRWHPSVHPLIRAFPRMPRRC